MARFRSQAATAILLAGGVFLFAAPAAVAGGGPENLFLVVNAKSQASLSVANYYCRWRHVPPGNVLHLDWTEGYDGVSIEKFRTRILGPTLAAIDSRGLANQIDIIAYSSDFPYRIDFQDDLPPAQQGGQFLSGSLTGMTYLLHLAMTKDTRYTGLANLYFREPMVHLGESGGAALATDGFRSWYGWGPRGQRLEAGGHRYALCTMLAYTSGRGTTLAESLSYLRRAVGSDGSHPAGTIYFVQNKDIRSKTRHDAYPAAVTRLKEAGVAAEIVDGDVPERAPDVQGCMLGTRDFDWKSTGSTILPGAICDHLTSFAGVMTENGGQTCLSEFLRYGAAGASGPVVEPYALQAKFPLPSIQVHYARGCSLAEAYYQSVQAPYQLLIVGDPLCQPWANIPLISVSGVESGATIRGTVELRPAAQPAGKAAVDRFELFVNGVRVGRCAAGDTFSLDTTRLADGHYELRVVGLEQSKIETQGRLLIPVTVDNRSRKLDFTAEADRVRSPAMVALSASAPGAKGIAVYHQSRLVGKIEGDQGKLTLDSATLGQGPVLLRAVAFLPGDAPERIVAKPLIVNVE